MAVGRSRKKSPCLSRLDLHSQVSFNVSGLGNLNKAFHGYHIHAPLTRSLLHRSQPDTDRLFAVQRSGMVSMVKEKRLNEAAHF